MGQGLGFRVGGVWVWGLGFWVWKRAKCALSAAFELHTRVQRFRGGLVFQAHRLWYHSTLGLRVIKKREEKKKSRPESGHDIFFSFSRSKSTPLEVVPFSLGCGPDASAEVRDAG